MSDARLLPTRLNLLRASRRLERVTKGAGLLRRKREALVVELFKLARSAADARKEMDDLARTGYRLLLSALAVHGRAGLVAASWPLRDLRVGMESGQVWGVAVARVTSRPPLERTMAARALAPGTAGPAAMRAGAEFERLTSVLLDAATEEQLIHRLGEALAQTSRQVHTLERRVAPVLRTQLAGVRRTLEEREREEHLRLKHITHRLRP
jgi:H(+)-transporting ATP synthase subunit D